MKSKNPSESFENLVKMFSYNHDLPLDLKKKDTEYKNSIAIHDISYSGLAEKRINAYLVKPLGEGPFSGIIFVHPGPGSRDTFLDEAIEIAENGAMSLLIDAPWANPSEFAKRAIKGIEKPEGFRDFFIEIAIELRRAFDLVTSLHDIDTDKIGYVGHSFGALFGGILSGIENRINTYVLMAGVGSFTDVALLNVPTLKEQKLENYRKTMNPIDPIHYISHAAPSSLFFQFGLQDTFFSKQIFQKYYETGSKPKSIQWYDADHYLNDKARKDRVEWLNSQLNLKLG